MTLKTLIKNKESKKRRFLWNSVEVIIKDKIIDPNISIHTVLKKIESKISPKFLVNIDVIYVGDFDFFKDRDIQAMYENSCIFVTNNQDSIEDMCDDIVHEIAHSLEEVYGDIIYFDGKLEKEFLEKRRQLYSVLKSENFEADLILFSDPSYSESFDQYLYKQIGYPTLNMLGASIFYSPYAATSLREYFANGFEALYYYRDYNFISKSCPELYSKLQDIMEVTQ